MSTKGYYASVQTPRRSVSNDTSGRLMNIIAKLSVSKSEDRKKRMVQLKEDFEQSDAQLIKLLSANQEQLSMTMEAFRKISAKNNTSQRGCHDVKEKMIACKKLLQCKREEIKRLWCESIEHHEVISMLKEINELRTIHHKVHDAIKQNDLTKATQLVVSSIDLLEGKLSSVDAIKELKLKVFELRETLHSVLAKELHKCLYMSPEHVFRYKTSASCERGEKTYEELFSKNYRKEKEIRLPVCAGGCTNDVQKDSNYDKISVILNCISALKRLPETVEVLKEALKVELNHIVGNSSKLMHDMLQNSTFPASSNEIATKQIRIAENTVEGEILLSLLEIILHKFRYVAINHQSLLHNLEKIMMMDNMPNISSGYELADVLSEIQASVEMFVSDYLDLHNTSGSSERATAALADVPAVSDVSSFFLRKNVMRHKRHALFKFDGSSHAINIKRYLQEEKASLNGMKDIKSVDTNEVVVCEPTVKNIIVIFKPLKQFVSEIELALGLESGTHCPLHTFLADCVKLFLDETNIEMNRLTEKGLEAWESIPDIDRPKKANIKTEILKSTFALNSTFKEMEHLTFALPDYSDHFLQLAYNMLLEYKDLCNSECKRLLISHNSLEEQQQVFSLSYALDEDISRLLRSLPNWTKLKVEDHEEESCDFEESPEEIRFRNKEESDLLMRNLTYSASKDSTPPCEIISDPGKLKNLALLHESMEWLSNNIIDFADCLPDCDIQSSVQSASYEKFCVSDDDNTEAARSTCRSSKTCLKQLAKDFEDLADTCLLILHLEVRTHSFHYLLPLSKQSSYMSRKDNQEAEPEVLRLNADLSRIEEALAPVLQPKKIKYIFEGLGELLSTILINSVSNIKKINENGVKKMCRNIFAIQQNLATITMTREVALDRAKQYFDLLNSTFEDILNQIVEEGPQFQEHEYSAVLQVLHNSREGICDQEPLDTYLDRLRRILNQVAVSV